MWWVTFGRLAPEKSIDFLADAMAQFVAQDEQAWFLVAGTGPCEDVIRRTFAKRNLSARLVLEGVMPAGELADAYKAMDVFAFASQSETQGMVLTEAMAAGVPVVAVDGPGVRETVCDGKNGRLLPKQNSADLVAALSSLRNMPKNSREQLQDAARATAEEFSMVRSAEQMLRLYGELIDEVSRSHHDDLWSTTSRRVAREWKIWENLVDSAGDAILQLEVEPAQCS